MLPQNVYDISILATGATGKEGRLLMTMTTFRPSEYVPINNESSLLGH